MSKRITGKIKKTGVNLFEVFEGVLEIPGDQNLNAYMQRFLERQGFKVNALYEVVGLGARRGARKSDAGLRPKRRKKECQWWHEQWPKESRWFYG
jgi:hypothetical protein